MKILLGIITEKFGIYIYVCQTRLKDSILSEIAK